MIHIPVTFGEELVVVGTPASNLIKHLTTCTHVQFHIIVPGCRNQGGGGARAPLLKKVGDSGPCFC